MTKLKQTYLSPETDLLVVRFEENLLTGSPYNGTSSKDTENIIDDGYEGL